MATRRFRSHMEEDNAANAPPILDLEWVRVGRKIRFKEYQDLIYEITEVKPDKITTMDAQGRASIVDRAGIELIMEPVP